MSPSPRVPVEVDGRTLTLSNLDKVLFPEVGFTKGQVIDYYHRIAPVMLPHLRDRPLTMRRFADGVESNGFFAKHRPSHSPDWVQSIVVNSVSERSSESTVEYPTIADLPTLIWAANLAGIELHVPLWHAGRRRKLPANPDYVVFDLDPGPGTSVVECAAVGLQIRHELEADGFEVFAKTSGSKGLQLYSPVGARTTWEHTRDLSYQVATQLERDHPGQVVSNMRKDLRKGRVLIDWSQNHPAKTTVAAYSIRARPRPTVSTPVSWEEVTQCARGGSPTQLQFTTDQVLERVESDGDLFVPTD